MKKLTLLPLLAVLLFAQTADAQLLRRIFRPPVQSGCANGQCEVPSVAQAVPVVAAQSKPDGIEWISHEEMAVTLAKLEAIQGWKETVAGVRALVAKEWKSEKLIAVDPLAYKIWNDTIGSSSEPAPRTLAAKSFAGALQSQLAANPNKGIAERHYLRILNGPDSPRRDRQIARMERLVRAELDIGPNQAIDWAAVDWGAILRFLLTILPLFL